MSFILLKTAEDSIGLVDKASLTQRALMDLVIQGIANKEVIRGDKGESAELTEWRGLTLEDDRVTQINWRGVIGVLGSRLHGPVHLEWLPLTVQIFWADSNQLTGTINLSHLSNVMECLRISANNFLGPIDMERLPREMSSLYLDNNRLNGSVELTIDSPESFNVCCSAGTNLAVL